MLIQLESTNLCNLNCECCPSRLNQRTKGVMSDKNFKVIIDNLEKYFKNIYSIRVVLHMFGEPLVSPYLWKNLDYLEKKKFTNVDISSNGVFLDNETINKLLSYKCLSFFRVSLNSSDKSIMEKINTGSDFDRVVKNTKNLIKKSVELTSSCKIWVQSMIMKNGTGGSKKEFIDLLESDKFIFVEKNYHNYRGQLPVTDKNLKEDYKDCIFGSDICIQWDGDVVGCCGDDTKSQVYGNVLKSNLIDIFNKREVFRSSLRKRDLTNLPLCKKCLGG